MNLFNGKGTIGSGKIEPFIITIFIQKCFNKSSLNLWEERHIM